MANDNKRTITKKKVKVVGKQKFFDENGEMHEMLVTSIEERDFNFTKVWLSSLLPQLKLIGNKKIEICMWVIEHLNRDNQLLYTYRQIAELCGVSLDTVNHTMQALIDCDFLRRQNIGCYVVNPDVLFKGSKSGREEVMFVYRGIDGKGNAPTSRTDQMKIDELQANIAYLQKKVDRLKESVKNSDLADAVADEVKRRSGKKKTVSEAVESSPQEPSEST